MSEYIEREALRDAVESIDWYSVYKGKLTAGAPSSANALYTANDIYSAINNAPAADVVSLETYKQCAWERDEAIRQLREDYGVELGQKKADVAPVRHGRWIEQEKYTFGVMYACSICDNLILDNGHSWNYCPNCGAKMDGVDGNSAIA